MILVVNGSPQGRAGNCAALIKTLPKKYPAYRFKVIHLANDMELPKHLQLMAEADGFLFTTGTYWDSWGSPLQQWLEKMTPYEGTSYFLNKPAAVVVLMHSVGGKGILSRLQGVLNTLGCVLPPMTGLVYSLVSDLALKSKSSHVEDFWSLEDLSIIFENLLQYAGLGLQVKAWPVDKQNPKRSWLKLTP